MWFCGVQVVNWLKVLKFESKATGKPGKSQHFLSIRSFVDSNALQYNENISVAHGGRLLSRIWGSGSHWADRGGYMSQVVREVRCVFRRRLKVANVLDSLMAAGNWFQMVGAEKLKKRLLKLDMQPALLFQRPLYDRLLLSNSWVQWRSNGLCSMCKAQGPTSLRGPLGLK